MNEIAAIRFSQATTDIIVRYIREKAQRVASLPNLTTAQTIRAVIVSQELNTLALEIEGMAKTALDKAAEVITALEDE